MIDMLNSGKLQDKDGQACVTALLGEVHDVTQCYCVLTVVSVRCIPRVIAAVLCFRSIHGL